MARMSDSDPARSALRIFANRDLLRRGGPLRPPADGDPLSSRGHASCSHSHDVEYERELLGLLESPPGPGETVDACFRRKEQRVAAMFAALSFAQARALHRRLAEPRPDDALAQRFHRLVAARRDRLLAFLADARRREARQP
jgi:hypothetical protein